MYLVAYAWAKINTMKNIVQMLTYVKPMSVYSGNVVVVLVASSPKFTWELTVKTEVVVLKVTDK